MRSTRKLIRALATAATLAVALAACSSQGGAQNQPSQGGGGGGGAAQGKRYTIAMVTHEQAGDTFWDKIRAGAQDASKSLNVDLKYSNNENGPEQATLVQNAIDSKVDGLAVTLSNADAVIPVAKKAAAAGIPVVVFNQGFDQYKQAGARCTSARTRTSPDRASASGSPPTVEGRRSASSRHRARWHWRPAAPA